MFKSCKYLLNRRISGKITVIKFILHVNMHVRKEEFYMSTCMLEKKST